MQTSNTVDLELLRGSPALQVDDFEKAAGSSAGAAHVRSLQAPLEQELH